MSHGIQNGLISMQWDLIHKSSNVGSKVVLYALHVLPASMYRDCIINISANTQAHLMAYDKQRRTVVSLVQ